jgi:YidC/Oxa1 family membrane protein insertase
MDKKAILAVMISLGIWVGWQKFYLEPIQKQASLQNQQFEQAKAVALAESNKAKELKEELNAKGILPESERNKLKQVELQQISLENDSARTALTNQNALFQNWELKNFTDNHSEKKETISVPFVTGFDSQMGIRFSDDSLNEAVRGNWNSLVKNSDRAATASLNHPKVNVTRTFELDETGYGAVLKYQMKFSGEAPKFVFVDLYGNPKRANDKEGSIFGEAPDKVSVTFLNEKERFMEMASHHKETKETPLGVKWMGLGTRYFELALVPTSAGAGAQVAQDLSRGQAVRGSLVFPTEGKKEIQFESRVYFGPKDMEALKGVHPVLVDAIDFGWTSFIAVPLLQSLKFLYSYVHNYGLAIIILTFVIKMLLFPLTYKSMKSMAKIAKLQPQLNALREKYKDDKEKLNAEMMSFMKTNGYNPVGGCLPILIQMPIFFALYRVLFNSMELYQAPFMGWIMDLSSPDPFFITPVLLTGLMYFQQKLSPSTAADPMQQKMLQLMPVIFGVFMLLLPAGLNIYMVVNSATSIAQQWVLNRKLGIVPAGKVAKA